MYIFKGVNTFSRFPVDRPNPLSSVVNRRLHSEQVKSSSSALLADVVSTVRELQHEQHQQQIEDQEQELAEQMMDTSAATEQAEMSYHQEPFVCTPIVQTVRVSYVATPNANAAEKVQALPENKSMGPANLSNLEALQQKLTKYVIFPLVR